MIIKLIEIRDAGTFIPAIIIKVEPRSESENYLIRTAGYGHNMTYVLMADINGDSKMQYDPHKWSNRTRQVAHIYCKEHFDTITTGDVIDVEHILGITQQPKTTQRLTT